MVSAISCERPDSQERFIKTSDMTEDSLFVYTLDMSDSLYTYSISLFTKIDSEEEALGDIEIDAIFKSPSERLYQDRIILPSAKFYKSAYFSQELMEEYRTGIAPVEYGKWYMVLKLVNMPDGLLGMGVKLQRDKVLIDGKR